MAKAPLFDVPVLGPAMEALGMIPAYRGSDNAKSVRRNIESLDICARMLADGHAVGIFPEGRSHDQVRVEAVRSGAARIAVQAAGLGASGLQVVPIGINYAHKERFRSVVWIRVGEPVDVNAWIEQHDGDSKKAMRALTIELATRLKEVVIHLDQPQWEPWLDDLEILAPRGESRPLAPDRESEEPDTLPANADLSVPTSDSVVSQRVEALQRRKRIADAMNYFLAVDRTRAQEVAGRIEKYHGQVHDAGLRVDSPVLDSRGWTLAATTLWRSACLLILAIPAILATVHHIAPFLVVREVASRLKPPGNTWTASYRLLIGIPVYGLWYALVGWWMFDYFASWVAWTWLLSMPIAGLIAVYFWRQAGDAATFRKQQITCVFQRRRLRQLRRQRAELSDQLRVLAREHAAAFPRLHGPVRSYKDRRLLHAAARGLAAAAIVLTGWLALNWVFDVPLAELHGGLDLSRLSASGQLQPQIGADEKALVAIIHGLDVLEARAIEVRTDFEAGRRSYQVDKDSDAVRQLLLTYLNYRTALLRLLWKYQRYGELDDQRLSLQAFLVDFTAASLLHESALKFVNQFDRSEETVAKLNFGEPNWGIPHGMYDTIKRNLASRENIRLFELARSHHKEMNVTGGYARYGLKEQAPHIEFHAAIAQSAKTAQELGGPVWQKKSEIAGEDLQNLATSIRYQTQSVVATWIGDVKIREPRGGRSLIEPYRVESLREKLRPGDILLERRNWYLSNAFLPGYWPHGAIYVGTPRELEELGLDRDERVARHWKEFTQPDAEGHEHVIIEAVSEGVLFSSLEHSIGGGDSAAVLRPRVTDEERKEAIARAFNQVGKPYDFEFDFETVNELVCTEVVFRTYGANAGPIRFPLVEILGRQTMPAIELVRKFKGELGEPDAELDFIAFIDGDEETGITSIGDESSFVGTLERPALTFLQGTLVTHIGSVGWALITVTVLCLLGVAYSKNARVRHPQGPRQ